jgi:hypothetical protein
MILRSKQWWLWTAMGMGAQWGNGSAARCRRLFTGCAQGGGGARIAESVCGPPGALLLEAKINLFGAPDIVVGFSAIPEAFLWADFADGKICRPLRDVANMQTRFRYQKPDGDCSDL